MLPCTIFVRFRTFFTHVSTPRTITTKLLLGPLSVAPGQKYLKIQVIRVHLRSLIFFIHDIFHMNQTRGCVEVFILVIVFLFISVSVNGKKLFLSRCLVVKNKPIQNLDYKQYPLFNESVYFLSAQACLIISKTYDISYGKLFIIFTNLVVHDVIYFITYMVHKEIFIVRKILFITPLIK